MEQVKEDKFTYTQTSKARATTFGGRRVWGVLTNRLKLIDHIHGEEVQCIDPHTIERHLGYTDSSGHDIYEGDAITITRRRGLEFSQATFLLGKNGVTKGIFGKAAYLEHLIANINRESKDGGTRYTMNVIFKNLHN